VGWGGFFCGEVKKKIDQRRKSALTQIMKLLNRLRAFTLIELLVVISIIGILAALAIPAVSGALTRAQLSQSLSNCRQLTLASYSLAMDATATGDATIPGWSSTSDFLTWAQDLTNAGLATNEIKKLLSASGVNAAWPPTAASSAINVYGVVDSSPGNAIFMTTKNWDATSPAALESDALPYGDKGFVVFRKGGDGAIYTGRQATNDITFFGLAPTNTL
jgi:prepilin-type N-terminal cleavage/methylation domain-containing protein